MSRFDYVRYDVPSQKVQAQFKELFAQLELMVSSKLEPGRAQSLVFTKLEEAYMWIGKAIRDDQLKRAPQTPLQEERDQS